jgi:hypothetical protein
MKLKFTNHSQYRIEERGISVEDIKMVLRKPDSAKETFGKTVANKKIERKTLEVVFQKGHDGFVIITAYNL